MGPLIRSTTLAQEVEVGSPRKVNIHETFDNSWCVRFHDDYENGSHIFLPDARPSTKGTE